MSIAALIRQMTDAGAPIEAVLIAVEAIEAERQQAYAREPDGHTCAKDSNRSRRGMSDTLWRKLRADVFARDGWLCSYCGAPDDLTCDHVVPLVRGGTNELSNLVTACRPCNSSKGDKLVSEWRAA